MWVSGLIICYGLRKKEQLRARLASNGQVWTAHENAARELMSLELEDMQEQVDKMSNEELAQVAMRMMEVGLVHRFFEREKQRAPMRHVDCCLLCGRDVHSRCAVSCACPSSENSEALRLVFAHSASFDHCFLRGCECCFAAVAAGQGAATAADACGQHPVPPRAELHCHQPQAPQCDQGH
jgi:hypothetical protein